MLQTIPCIYFFSLSIFSIGWQVTGITIVLISRYTVVFTIGGTLLVAGETGKHCSCWHWYGKSLHWIPFSLVLSNLRSGNTCIMIPVGRCPLTLSMARSAIGGEPTRAMVGVAGCMQLHDIQMNYWAYCCNCRCDKLHNRWQWLHGPPPVKHKTVVVEGGRCHPGSISA